MSHNHENKEVHEDIEHKEMESREKASDIHEERNLSVDHPSQEEKQVIPEHIHEHKDVKYEALATVDEAHPVKVEEPVKETDKELVSHRHENEIRQEFSSSSQTETKPVEEIPYVSRPGREEPVEVSRTAVSEENTWKSREQVHSSEIYREIRRDNHEERRVNKHRAPSKNIFNIRNVYKIFS